MFYTIYKTTNLINGKIYIGKHQTKNINDLYIGSGKHLNYAIQKYGIENFEKEILFIFDNEQDMNAKEAELVTEEFVKEDNNYNLCPGGKGGWGYLNSNGISINNFENLEIARKASKKANLVIKIKYSDYALRKEYNKKISDGLKLHIDVNGHWWSGKKHTEETKNRMRKPKNVGVNNPQFGKMWITNGSESKRISKEEIIPEGWYKGRKMN